MFFSLHASNISIDTLTEEQNILKNHAIEKIKNKIYFLPARKSSKLPIVYQPLQQFDLIFTGHDVNTSIKKFNSYQNLAALTPGKYTHVLMYIGKDANDLAYAVEMNIDKNKTFSVTYDSLSIGGGLRLVCLGKDFEQCGCPADDQYSNVLKRYDYDWAKRLTPELELELLHHKSEFLKILKQDLTNKYPFQVPLDLTMFTAISKVVHLIEDGHKNGSDCVSYFVSLYEEILHICLDDVRIDAKTMQSYYLHNPLGRRAVFPAYYNPISDKDILIRDLLEKKVFHLQKVNQEKFLVKTDIK
jgi:hypothetical protein